jgi:hypothetical protein
VEELKKAYSTMGLEETASREEVEKRYETLMRQNRSRAKQQSDEPEDSFSKVTQAYRLILEHEDRKITDAFNEQEYGKYKKMAGQAQKMDHFWRYYRFHTLGAIVAVALIIYGIISFIDYREEKERLANLPPVDLNVSFMGNFMLKEEAPKEEPVENALLAAFPEWKRFVTTTTFVPADESMQYAYLQKAILVLATEHPDVYVMDRSILTWIGNQPDLLLNMDDWAEGDFKPLLKEGIAQKFAAGEDGEEHVYAFDLTKSKLADDLPLYHSELLVGIRSNAKNPDNAKAFIEKYLGTLK